MSDMGRLLRIEEVMARIWLRRIKIYAMIREGVFPEPYKLTPKAARWSEQEVTVWIERAMTDARTTG